MAAAGEMYCMKPLYNVERSVAYPDCMYKVDRLIPKPEWDGQGSSPLTLEERQVNLLKKLDKMIACVSSKLGQTTTSESTNFISPGSGMNEILQFGSPVDLVIRANPSHPPKWLGLVKEHLENIGVRSWWKYHTHSSVTTPPPCGSLPTRVPHEDRYCYEIIVTVIWSNDGQCPSLHISPAQRTPICGETNIFRFFGRLLNIYDTSSDSDAIIDTCLDACDVILAPSSTKQEKASVLKSLSLAIDNGSLSAPGCPQILAGFLASVLGNYGLKDVPQGNLRKWLGERLTHLLF